MPSQKVGTVWPIRVRAIRARSKRVPRRIAASTAAGTETSTASAIAARVSSRVAGSRSSATAAAGVRKERDWPKSPCARRPR